MNYSHSNDIDRGRRGQREHQGYDPDPCNNLLSAEASDERLRQDASAALKQYGILNPDAISVRARAGIVTLTGDVSSRHAKRAAEECVQRLSGVALVSNRLRVGFDREHDNPPSISPSSSSRSWNAPNAGQHAEPSRNRAR